ncbi:MAG: protocatechuate 3,4-dioxygenase subunit alpha [Minwuia sp.]|nr:protocatechuate 3,4-dioxygenase subunit alpha [Minwuia sp.]
MAEKQTPSQTVGPFFAYGLTARQYGYRHPQVADGQISDATADGTAITVVGQVLDGQGVAVGDAMLEIWQADAAGQYPNPSGGGNTGFRGFARVGTGADASQTFRFDTIKPGAVDGRQAPHLNVIVFMRGLLNHCHTRIWFSDEAAANAADPVLASIPEARRGTVIAQRQDTPQGPVYRFDIHMQGDQETVFFDI